jgi:hypothetical protein
LWAVPDEYAALPKPRLLKQLTRLANRRRIPKATSALLEHWLEDSGQARCDVVWALESLAWCHLLPRLQGVVPEQLWRDLYELLLDTATSAAAIGVHDDPVRHQLLSAELPLTLASVLPHVQACRDLVTPAGQSLSFALAELLDGNGLPAGAYLPSFRLLLACWTRCSLLDAAGGWRSFDAEARRQYECMVRQSLRLARPDGTLLLSHGVSGQWCADLLHTALQEGGGRKDRMVARLVLPGQRGKKKRGAKKKHRARQLPKTCTYSEWGEIGVLRATWSRKSPQFVCRFDNQRLHSELVTAGQLLWSGDVTPVVSIAGQPLTFTSGWSELCWFTDKDVDYLEVEVECAGGWVIQRQMLLARAARFLLLADAILGPQAAPIHYELRLPLSAGMRSQGEGETCEAVLGDDQALSAVLPLALAEWRAAASQGTLEADSHTVRLSLDQTGQRLYAPLLFDLAPRRVSRPRTWRQLTVAEQLVTQPRDVAVGYRVQLGYDQWLIYRSLAPRSSRSVLGQNLADEFVAARFNSDGVLDSLIEVE